MWWLGKRSEILTQQASTCSVWSSSLRCLKRNLMLKEHKVPDMCGAERSRSSHSGKNSVSSEAEFPSVQPHVTQGWSTQRCGIWWQEHKHVFSDIVTDKRWLEQQSTAATVPSKLRSNKWWKKKWTKNVVNLCKTIFLVIRWSLSSLGQKWRTKMFNDFTDHDTLFK